VAGKLRGQRAKAMKFRDGYMVKTGNSAVVFQDYATRHVMMRQGIMGVRVKVMLPYDPEGIIGPKIRLSDVVEILQPKEEQPVRAPAHAAHQQQAGANPGAPFVAAPQAAAAPAYGY
jgi:small subunit ribosomal protein S3e